MKKKQFMTRRFLLLLFISTFGFFTVSAQISESDLEKIRAFEDSMVVDAFLVVNDTFAESRFLATKDLIFHLKGALKYRNSFNYPFERLKSISIQYAPDSSFRVFTWQLMVDKTNYRYFGAIQMNTPEVQLIPLADRSEQIEYPETMELSNLQWYGALYYNIRKVNIKDKAYYLLFGFDSYTYRDRRKLLEVLSITDEGINFGAPIIPTGTGSYLHRLILEYHASSSVRLNYDDALEMIVYDHLITIPGRNGEGPMQVSDGSYQGLKITPEAIVLEDKLFNNQAVDEAPREEPVLGENRKDLFGRERKKKN